MINNILFNILKASIYGEKPVLSSACDYEVIFSELQLQTVLTLTKPVLNQLPLSDELCKKWEKAINQQLAVNAKVAFEERKLCALLEAEGIEFAIVKGTAAAQYYPRPELRTRGDIDVILKPEIRDSVSEYLINNGYTLESTPNKTHRYIALFKNGVSVELHQFFFTGSTNEEISYFDLRLYKAIESNKSWFLPDKENGLVLLEHIRDHMTKVGGDLGLRQVIDWMMFVDKVCDNDFWAGGFKALAEEAKVADLAVALTAMCKKFLGLPQRITWCDTEEPLMLDELMEYFLSSGNFGSKTKGTGQYAINALSDKRGVIGWLKYFQRVGTNRWPLAQRSRFFRCFAWLHQLLDYLKRYLKENSLSELSKQKKAADKKSKLYNQLGI